MTPKPNQKHSREANKKGTNMLHLFPELFGEENTNINIDNNAELTDEDMATILLHILRRAVLDASGDKPIDAFLTHGEKEHARDYLTIGYIKRYGYHYYDDTNLKYTPKRNHESLAEKYQPMEEPQYSPIPLNHILDYFNIDHEAFNCYICDWEEDNWSRDNKWYKSFIEQTNVI